MLEIVPTRQFQKDLTKASMRGKSLDKIGSKKMLELNPEVNM